MDVRTALIFLLSSAIVQAELGVIGSIGTHESTSFVWASNISNLEFSFQYDCTIQPCTIIWQHVYGGKKVELSTTVFGTAVCTGMVEGYDYNCPVGADKILSTNMTILRDLTENSTLNVFFDSTGNAPTDSKQLTVRQCDPQEDASPEPDLSCTYNNFGCPSYLSCDIDHEGTARYVMCQADATWNATVECISVTTTAPTTLTDTAGSSEGASVTTATVATTNTTAGPTTQGGCLDGKNCSDCCLNTTGQLEVRCCDGEISETLTVKVSATCNATGLLDIDVTDINCVDGRLLPHAFTAGIVYICVFVVLSTSVAVYHIGFAKINLGKKGGKITVSIYVAGGVSVTIGIVLCFATGMAGSLALTGGQIAGIVIGSIGIVVEAGGLVYYTVTVDEYSPGRSDG